MNYNIPFCLLLLLCSACAFTKEQSCHQQAEQKFALYNKPDTYPVPDYEKANVLTALFNECMSERGEYKQEVDMKNAKPVTETVPILQPTVVTTQQPPDSPAQIVSQSYTTQTVTNPVPSPAPVAVPAPAPAPVAISVTVPEPAAKLPEPKPSSTALPAIMRYTPAADKELEDVIMK